MSNEPTIDERLKFYRENAEAFVQSMSTMVSAAERDGDTELAIKLKVWALMPWQAALRDDAADELWPTCEACGQPIKIEAERISSDACDFHRDCIPE